ncbi:chromate resistance protein ChrB domain-containing protein [Dongia deserti]|uniref:chromate resistance protein ChrB domain-containing protein n=1 Tax=Dongia deserti TaxID=2268030 RepID=UPI00254673CA|nr:chromate resistance protein ChrB domain-containing protein [Dongia deserti]
MSDAEERADRWLLLIHQLSAKPAYFRVKVWRRLQGIGAIGVKNSVYVLPSNEQTQEDFEWIRREIADGGGEAMVCEARMIEGLDDQEIRQMFRAERDADYDAVANEARELTAAFAKASPNGPQAEAKGQVARLRTRLTQIAAIDFFGANSRETAEGIVSALEAKIREEGPMPSIGEERGLRGKVAGSVWVTRRGVQIDRIASAWLIRRFIDPTGEFKFVDGKGYKPEPGELRFDMFEAEYTHEGDRCTFEVLLQRAGLRDSALMEIAEIVHDIDLKDGKFGREEAAGFKMLIDSVCVATADDNERIARAKTVLDDLYQYFQKQRGSSR